MGKRLGKFPHPDAWLWEQLERMLSAGDFERLRQEYHLVFAGYCLNELRQHYKGPVPELVRESIKEQLKAIKIPQAKEIINRLSSEEAATSDKQIANNEQLEGSGFSAEKATRCGNCKRVGNQGEDWLCYKCRDKTDDVIAKLRDKGPRKAWRREANDIIAQALAFIQLVEALDEAWTDVLQFKLFRAKTDHMVLSKLLAKSGRPSEPIYDEAHRLISELGYRRKRAIEEVRSKYPEAKNVSNEQFYEVLKKRKKLP